MKNLSRSSAKFLLSGFCLLLSTTFYAQTPGLIVRDGNGTIPPAVKSPVLDPDLNGYTSVSTSGFSGSDVGVGFSEIPYKPVPPLFPEPLADLRRGPNGRFSEIVKTADGSGFYMFYDAVNSRLLMRLRISSIMSGSKGYSALFDTDGKFGATGPDADPTYQAQTTGTNGNPGFEYEIVLETNFRIAVYFINTSCGTAPSLVYSSVLSVNPTHAQTSVALTTEAGDPDFFYDWYVPLTAFAGPGFPVTTSTPLRIQTTTVMSPQGAICGPKSDLYGDDNLFGTPQSQYEATVQAQPTFSLTDMTSGGTGIGSVCTAAPTVTSPIASSATSISGTWTKASYSSLTTATITIYRERLGVITTLGTVSGVTSGSNWTLNGITVGNIANNDIITARAQATGESQCLSSNSVLILSCTPATSSICPTVTCITRRGAQGGGGIVGATLTIYRINADGTQTVAHTQVLTASTWSWDGGNGGGSNICNTGAPSALPAGTYYVTQQETGKCESACTNYICNSTTVAQTALPVITTDPVFTGTSNIVGTAVAASTVRLFLNNVLKATVTATGGNFTFPIASYYPNLGDVFTVTAQSTGECMSGLVSKTVQCFVSAPVINANASSQVGVGTQLSGLSSEAAGTTVTIYNGSNTVIGTTIVAANGTWTLTSPTVAAATTYYALHTGTACGTSGASATVSSLDVTPSARCGTITGPVTANATSVSGTVTTGVTGTVVTLYIDGVSIGSFTFLTATTAWTISGLSSSAFNNVYPGGVLTIGISTGTTMEVICAASSTVQCITPTAPSVTPTTTTIAAGQTVTYTISSTQSGILYALRDNSDASNLGISTFGDGGTITATTTPFNTTGTFTVQVKAISFSSGDCKSLSPVTVIVTGSLPLVLLDFQVMYQSGISKLKWATTSEQNLSRFEIERSIDNARFTSIGQLAATGVNGNDQHYSFEDRNPEGKTIYYRLRMIDLDGKEKYSNVVVVRFPKNVGISIWPNPFSSSVTVNINSSQTSEAELRITDITGRTIIVQRNQVVRGNNQLNIEKLQKIPAGTYLLEINIQSEASRQIFKIIKQ